MLFDITPTLLDAGVAAIYLWIIYGPNLVWTVLVTCGLYVAITTAFQPTKNKLRSLKNDIRDSVQALKNESIANTDVVKYFSAERFEINRFREGSAKNQHVSFQYNIYEFGIDLAQNLVIYAGADIAALATILGLTPILFRSTGWVSTRCPASCQWGTACRFLCDIRNVFRKSVIQE